MYSKSKLRNFYNEYSFKRWLASLDFKKMSFEKYIEIVKTDEEEKGNNLDKLKIFYNMYSKVWNVFEKATRDLKLIIQDFCIKYKGMNHKCVCDGFTESEHKFKNLLNAKKCAKEINIVIKNLIKNKLFNFDMKNIIKPQAMVMPKTYEKNGDRTIVRPDYSYDKSYKAKSCGKFKS
jgi:hypothetical protein